MWSVLALHPSPASSERELFCSDVPRRIVVSVRFRDVVASLLLRTEAPIANVPHLGATLIATRDDIAVCEKSCIGDPAAWDGPISR